MQIRISTKALLVEMFREMVLKKNIAVAPQYYHRDFVLESNGQRHSYEQFVQGHKALYATGIRYEVRYDERSWVESDSSVAVRMWIKTAAYRQSGQEFEVVLIATFIDNKIFWLKELTWPDWTQASALQAYVERPVEPAREKRHPG